MDEYFDFIVATEADELVGRRGGEIAHVQRVFEIVLGHCANFEYFPFLHQHMKTIDT
jgi:hypothetical protein